MNSQSPEIRIIDQDSWIDFPPLNALDVKSDIDGDAAYLLVGQSINQVESLSKIALQYLEEGNWIDAPFSESSYFPSLGSIAAPCWYFPFNYHPGFEFTPNLRGNRPKWRAVVPVNWAYPQT